MRIYHLDLKVAMFQTAWLRNWFKRLRERGYDGVCIEIDNKLIFPSHPEFAAPDALSAEQWRGLIRYGRGLGLLMYPLIQTIGHMEHVLVPDTPLRKLAEAPGNTYTLCPSKPAVADFIDDLIRDANDVFENPGRIHLGGDECRYVGTCPRCAGRPISEILAAFMRHVHGTAAGLGMQSEFWADMVLAHPATLDELPSDIILVDWLYNRKAVRGPSLQHCWGYSPTEGLDAKQLLAGLPARIEPLRPFMVNADGSCNAFYGAHFLKSRGYALTLGSGVRSGGDSYMLPRTRQSILNVGATQQAAEELGADHMVTSWAVRLSHPETTWPAMLSESPSGGNDGLERCGAPVGGLDQTLLDDLDVAQAGIGGVDILAEQLMRFQRPFYGDWMGHVRELASASDAGKRLARIESRVEASGRLLRLFEERLSKGTGERDVMRHWICGLRLGELRARQTLAAVRHVHGTDLAATLRPLVEENRNMMEDFAALWSESLTPHSLNQELEFKFRRDIRVLAEIIG